jgi:hypothetical protein
MQEHNRIAASVDNTNNAKAQPNYGVCGQHKQCKNTTELRRLWTTQTMQKHNRITASVDNTNNANTHPNYGVCGQYKRVVHRRRNSVVLLHCLCCPQTPQFGCVLALFVSSTDAVIRLCSCIVWQCKSTTELRRLWTTQTMQKHNRSTASVDNTNNAKTQPNYGVSGLHKQCKSTTELRRLWTTQTMQKHNRISFCIVCVVHRRRNSVVFLHCLCCPQTP